MESCLTSGVSVVAPGAGLLVSGRVADVSLVDTAPPLAQTLDCGGRDARIGYGCHYGKLCVLIAAGGWYAFYKSYHRCFKQVERVSGWPSVKMKRFVRLGARTVPLPVT